jgi:hypothetical protein
MSRGLEAQQRFPLSLKSFVAPLECDSQCPNCQARVVRSRARGAREDLAFMMGSEIFRCSSCEARFLCFRWFSIPTPPQYGYVSNESNNAAFLFIWSGVFAGFLSLGIAFWAFHRFHRWPF